MGLDKFDIAIIGGGIAGLSSAIQCAQGGLKVGVYERGTYPKHKVCGEYISRESLVLLQSFGLDIDSKGLPQIDRFRLTDRFGNNSECELNPGGFGWSRYQFDDWLRKQAKELGVYVSEGASIRSQSGSYKEGFRLSHAKDDLCEARLVLDASGRMPHVTPRKSDVSWVGIKYHVVSGPESNYIEIHAFDDGYAGISQVEDGKYCLCYLVKSEQLKKHGSIEALERNVLAKNDSLSKRLKAERIMGPITTSQFYFGVNSSATERSVGDAAGFIPPLTGNGMSLALRGSKVISNLSQRLLSGEIQYDQYCFESNQYRNDYLNKRLRKGIVLQDLLFLKPEAINRVMMSFFSHSPWALRQMTAMAVGDTI
ncbi:MAG: NAD(P)/FAD-dependent oxidoreductase [Salibacteraceae bacterium]